MNHKSLLPSDREEVYIPRIESLISDRNIQKAALRVKRNKGAPGIDGITVQEIEKAHDRPTPTVTSHELVARRILKRRRLLPTTVERALR